MNVKKFLWLTSSGLVMDNLARGKPGRCYTALSFADSPIYIVTSTIIANVQCGLNKFSDVKQT